MNSERKLYKLADLCVSNSGIQTGPFGSQLHNKDYVKIGTPIITVEHLGENRITFQNLPRVSNADKLRLHKYTLKKGDIVFSRVGSVDRRSLVREAEDGWLFSGRCLRVRLDLNLADPEYVAFLFGTQSFKEHMRSIAVGATMPSINTKLLSEVKIALPSLKEQNAIAGVLSSLDDKIELNRQMCKTLEDIAGTLFKSWFIDFDPVKAKAAGRKPEGLSPEMAELFPDSFVDSSLGKIPKGWEKKQLGEIITLKYGKALNAKDRSDGKIPVYGSSGIIGYHNQAIIKGPSIIVGRKGNVGTIYWTQSDFYPIDTVYYVDSSRTNRYLYHSLKNLIFHNNDSAVPGLNRDYAHRQILIYPQETIIHQFENVTKGLFNKTIHLETNNQKLIQTRDLLLPKLINGEVKIQEAETLISATI